MVSQTVDMIISAEKQAVKMIDDAYDKSEQIIAKANEQAKEIIDKANCDIKAELDKLTQNNNSVIAEIFDEKEKLTAQEVSEIRNDSMMEKENAIDVVISSIISK